MSDTFTFHIPQSQKPFTRHEVLSVVNSLFDPLGFLVPVTVKGRLFLRELSNSDLECDSTYVSFSISQAKSIELCMLSDASVKATAAAAYLRVTLGIGHSEVGFIMGKAKLAPVPELTTPRLGLLCHGARCGDVRASHRRT